MQIESLESQVKSNNKLTVSNTEEIKKARKIILDVSSRLDSCSSGIDELTFQSNESKKVVDDLKRGTKRKWEEMSQFANEVDQEIVKFKDQMMDLETSILDLSLQIKELKTNQKKFKSSWIKSAAVGASAAIAVVAGVILSPDWS